MRLLLGAKTTQLSLSYLEKMSYTFRSRSLTHIHIILGWTTFSYSVGIYIYIFCCSNSIFHRYIRWLRRYNTVGQVVLVLTEHPYNPPPTGYLPAHAMLQGNCRTSFGACVTEGCHSLSFVLLPPSPSNIIISLVTFISFLTTSFALSFSVGWKLSVATHRLTAFRFPFSIFFFLLLCHSSCWRLCAVGDVVGGQNCYYIWRNSPKAGIYLFISVRREWAQQHTKNHKKKKKEKRNAEKIVCNRLMKFFILFSYYIFMLFFILFRRRFVAFFLEYKQRIAFIYHRVGSMLMGVAIRSAACCI